MRRIVPFLVPLTLATVLGCHDELPTDVGRAPDARPQLALGNGPVTLVNGPVTPLDGGVVTSPVVTIDNGPGDQEAPRVSGDVACYRDLVALQGHTYRFSTGSNDLIPPASGPYGDGVCDIDGNHVGFARGVSGPLVAYLYDLGTGTVTELDPQPGVRRPLVAVGGMTAAFVEFPPFGTSLPQTIRVVDLTNPAQSDLLASAPAGRQDAPLSVSPDGNLVVWGRCDRVGTSAGANCDVMKAGRTGASWGAPELVANAHSPNGGGTATDGSYIVWADDTPVSATGTDIYIQGVGGGPVTRVAIAGIQFPIRVRGGVIAFYGFDADGSWGTSVYIIATNTVYQIATTPSLNEVAGDVDVLPNGDIRVVWLAFPATTPDGDIFATTFTPASGPTFSFGGFRAPVDNPPTVNLAKAGAAIPVKFSLGGDRGLNIFQSGYPSSGSVTCSAGAPIDPVEQTITAGNSGLSYDAASDTYSYIWKTDKTWANTCRRLALRFVDGTVANADFQFSK